MIRGRRAIRHPVLTARASPPGTSPPPSAGRTSRAVAALARADLFVSIGTSGAVYPAAGFVRIAHAAGADTLELNLERSDGSGWFAETRLGPATRLVPAWVDALLA